MLGITTRQDLQRQAKGVVFRIGRRLDFQRVLLPYEFSFFFFSFFFVHRALCLSPGYLLAKSNSGGT